jgi:hypothetical protein
VNTPDQELEEPRAEVLQQAQAETKAALEEKVCESQSQRSSGELRKHQHEANMFGRQVPASAFVILSGTKENVAPSKKQQKFASK